MKSADYVEWNKLKEVVQSLQADRRRSGAKMALFINLGMHVALRVSDLTRLKWADLMTDENDIAQPVKKLVVVEKKTKKTRHIALSDEIRDFIASTYSGQCPDEYVFQNRLGGVVSTRYLNEEFKRIAKRYNVCVDTFSTHSLRKTWARHKMELNPADPMRFHQISEALNHSDLGVTRRYLGIKQEEIDNLYLEE
jgi:integrase